MPSPTNPGEEGIVDAPGNNGNASMLEQVKRPNPWRKMMMIYLVVDTTKSNFFTPFRTADVSIISPRQIVRGQELVMCLK
jgi:hypothetical protein